MATKLEWVLDQLEAASGSVRPPSADGWELVLRENVGYLVDDDVRERAFEALERATGLDPERILKAPPEVLASVVVGMRPMDRVERLRRCADLRLSNAPWKAYPGIGRPGVERIELFSGVRAVLALESNGARTLVRLGYGAVCRSYDATYRSVQEAAASELPSAVAPLARAHVLLRRHGQTVCRRVSPSCGECPAAARCQAASSGEPIAGAGVQPRPDGTLVVVMSCGGKTFLSASTNEGATWKVLHQIPHAGTLRADSNGNLFLLRTSNTSSGLPLPTSSTGGGAPALYLSHSADGGKTWSPELNMVAPGVTSAGTVMFAQGTHAPGQVGHVAVTYYANRVGKTTSDGFITETHDALDQNPVFWSGQVNRPDRPLLYNTPGVNIGITVLDFLGGALSMDGRSVCGAWVQDCGDNLVTDVHCRDRLPAENPANAQDGFAGRLVWPPSS